MAGLLVSACGGTQTSTSAGGAASSVSASTSTLTAVPTSRAATPVPTAASSGIVPVRIEIPSIGVRASVEQVGETSAGEAASPARWEDAAWFAPGYLPGTPGHAVILGHLDTDLSAHPEAVFYHLSDVRPGDVVVVTASDGRTQRWRVTSLDRYPVNGFPLVRVFGPAPAPALELLTCAGHWRGSSLGYDQRLVISADLVS